MAVLETMKARRSTIEYKSKLLLEVAGESFLTQNLDMAEEAPICLGGPERMCELFERHE